MKKKKEKKGSQEEKKEKHFKENHSLHMLPMKKLSVKSYIFASGQAFTFFP